MTVQQKRSIEGMKRDGQSYAEIAQALKLCVNTVKSYGRRSGVTMDSSPLAEGMCRCEQCGCFYRQPDKRRSKLFCSDKCRVIHWHKNLPFSNSASKKPCPVCGQIFVVRGARKYCCHACYIRARFGGAVHEHAV